MGQATTIHPTIIGGRCTPIPFTGPGLLLMEWVPFGTPTRVGFTQAVPPTGRMEQSEAQPGITPPPEDTDEPPPPKPGMEGERRPQPTTRGPVGTVLPVRATAPTRSGGGRRPCAETIGPARDMSRRREVPSEAFRARKVLLSVFGAQAVARW